MGRLRSVLGLVLLLAVSAAHADTAPTWPQTFTQNGNQLVVYQPQLDAWANRLTLTGRAAVLVTAKGGAPVSGVLQLSASTNTDMLKRTVALSNVQIVSAQFPSATPAAATQATALAKSLLPTDGATLSLDNLLAALAQSGATATSVTLNDTPPAILLAGQPSRLVQFEGAPSFATVPNTTVQYAVNTNWPLLQSTDGGGYFLLDSTGWLQSDDLASGEWSYISQLPAAFSQLPDTAQWQDVRAHIPAPPSEGQPPLQIYVTTTPAELIVMVGEPQYSQIPGTGIYSITNTQSLVFWDGYASAFYYLVAGRWFTAKALAGPWSYATGALPADLAKIPPDNALAAVLPSVPNTPEAREAALQAQIPQLATVRRNTQPVAIAYDGAPQFAPIDGTALAYAANTASDVIQVGDSYYLCQKGVWFVAATPNGPWSVAASVPDAIYGMPPSSPLYNLTYVRVYDANDDAVVDGYTDGYLGEYVSDGVVTWGTGYYYPPYLAVGTLPYYYPRAYTYGADAFYNQTTGRFYRAGYGYGPYGGIAGSAAYDPATGAYSRRVAAAGPVQSGAAVEAYNPRTSTYAAGYERSNPYSSWEQGVVYGPDASAHASKYSNDRGSVARVQTSSGGEAIAATNGNREAEVVRSPGGEWYAGGDGNAYRRTDAGWQRYGARQGGYASDPYVTNGLDQAYAARQREAMLQQRYSGWAQRDFGGYGGGRFSSLVPAGGYGGLNPAGGFGGMHPAGGRR